MKKEKVHILTVLSPLPHNTIHLNKIKDQIVCTRNKKKNADILTRIIHLKLENV